MKIRRLALIALFASAWLPAARPAAADSNTTAFTLDALDARAFAMGGILVALPTGDTGMRWNPAMMVYSKGAGATAGYSVPFDGLNASHTGATASTTLGGLVPDARPEFPTYRSAVGLMLLSSGFDLSEGARWSETTVGVGYARAFNPYVAAGAVLKMMGNSTAASEGSASGYALDIGGGVLLSPTVQLGLTFHNAMGRVSWKDSGISESPPTLLDLGGALTTDHLRGELNLEVSSAETARAQGGLELALLGGALQLRGGSRFFLGPEPRAVPTAGAGIQVGRLHLDVAAAFDQAEALGTTRAFSLGYRF